MADSKFLHIKGSRVQVYKTLPSNDVGNDGDIILSQIQGRGVYLCSKVNGKWHVSSKMEELRKIEKTSTKDFRTNKLRVLDDLSIGRGTTQITKDEAKFSSSLKIKEAANAISDTAAYGQLWVKTATPNQLYFTTDAGDDIQITSGTATAFVGDITSVVAGTNCSGGGTSGDVTINVDDAFLINNGSDTTTGTITAGGFTTTGTITMPELTDDAAIGITKIQDSGTSFTDNDTSIMTAAAIADKIEGYGYSTTAGDITGVTAGDGLSGGGTSGTVSLAVGVDDSTIETDSDVLRVKDAGVTLAKMADIADNRILGRYDEGDAGAPIALTASATRLLLNVADGATANTGDITGVPAGTNCSGGGTSGGVTINVDDAFIVNDADDTMVGTLTIDKNSSTSTTHSNYGEKIDLDFSGNPSSGQTVTNYGLDIDFDFTGANGTGGNTNSYGINIAMNAEAGSHSAASGIDNIGIKEVLTGDTETGDTTQRGFDCTITGGDVGSQIGLYLNTADGSTDYKAVSSADTADYFSMATTANGATTLATVDGGATAAHFILDTDGDITLDAASGNITVKDNGGNYTPSSDYHIATKKYVDDNEANTMGSGFTVSATTDTNATTITQGDDLMFTAGTGITCETTADGTVTITNTVSDTNTTYSGGTNLTLSTTTFNVDDAFLVNDDDDTTTGTITAGGFTTTGTWTMDTSAGGTTGITNINITNAFTDDDVTIMSAGAIKDKIEGYSYSTTTGTVTSVGTTGTVNGLTLTGTVTSSGNLTLGGTLAISNGDWSGTDLSVANGGTGASTLTDNSILTGTGTSAITAESNLTFDGTDLSIAATGKIYLDGGGDTYITESSADSMQLVSGGDVCIQLDENGDDGNSVYFREACAGFSRLAATFSTSGVIGDGNDSTDVDFRFSNKYELTLTNNISGSSEFINMIFPSVSGNFLLTVVQDGTGSRTVASAGWVAYAADETLCDNTTGTNGTDGQVRWAGGSAPTLTTGANKTDVISIYWDANEQTAFCVATLNF